MVALMINGIVGAGIFGLPSKIHAIAGAYALIGFAACALVMAAITLCFAEVSSRFTLTGGPYLYAEEAFGPWVGFLSGWLIWITRLTAIATIATVMTSYLAFFWSPAASGSGRAAAMTVAIAALTILNLAGVRQTAGVVMGLTIAKLVPLLLFVGVGLFSIDPHRFAGARPPSVGSLSQVVLQLVFAFGGFEAAVIAAGECKDPRRDVPFALLISIVAVTLLYAAIQVVSIGTLPALATSEKPLADAAVRFMGGAGASVVALGALISTLGTLCASLLVGPRVLFAMSERERLPRWLARTHPRRHTPQVAILLTAGAALALGLTGTFTRLLTLSVIARLACYLLTAIAVPVLRRRARGEPALFSIPGAPAVVSLAIAACLWLLSRSGARERRDVAIAIALGLLLHVVHLGVRAREHRTARIEYE
jgi:amino acid transporter